MGSDSESRVPPALTTDSAAVAATPARGAPGQVLAGKWQLVAEIGRGGMGEVWQAKRLGWDDAEVAVKLMITSMADTSISRARFEREARSAAKLRSQHVVKVFDYGLDEATGIPFIVMERLDGESLGHRLRRLTVLSPEEVIKLVKHLGRALSCAHAARVVHRDLKPDNVFLVENGDEPLFKVLDFGLAKSFDTQRIHSRAVTVQGDAVGTPVYMSPEHLSGMAPNHLGDLWSLAVIACECLVGSKSFLPLWTLLLFAGERPVPSQLGVELPGFDAWFAKATHRHIEERFQSAQELVDALCGSTRRDMPPVEAEKKVGPTRVASLPPVTLPPPSTYRSFLFRHKMAATLLATLAVGVGVNALILRPGAPPRASTTDSPALASAPVLAAPPALQAELPATVHETAPAGSNPELPGKAPAVAEGPAPTPPRTPPVGSATPLAVEPESPPPRPSLRRKPRRVTAQPVPPDDRNSPTPNEDF